MGRNWKAWTWTVLTGTCSWKKSVLVWIFIAACVTQFCNVVAVARRASHPSSVCLSLCLFLFYFPGMFPVNSVPLLTNLTSHQWLANQLTHCWNACIFQKRLPARLTPRVELRLALAPFLIVPCPYAVLPDVNKHAFTFRSFLFNSLP